jgi:hypothetical protein
MCNCEKYRNDLINKIETSCEKSLLLKTLIDELLVLAKTLSCTELLLAILDTIPTFEKEIGELEAKTEMNTAIHQRCVALVKNGGFDACYRSQCRLGNLSGYIGVFILKKIHNLGHYRIAEAFVNRYFTLLKDQKIRDVHFPFEIQSNNDKVDFEDLYHIKWQDGCEGHYCY